MSKIIGVTVGTPLSPSFIKQKFKPMEDKVNELQQAVEDHLPEAVNEALAQAKASGAFDGADGKDGQPGKDGYTPQKGIDYFDGQPGKNGADGKDGYTPVKGVDYFDGQPGKDGVDGQPGKDGYTPVKGVDYFDGKDGQDGSPGTPGKDGADGKTPVKGTDYYTEADKTEMVNAVLEQIEIPECSSGLPEVSETDDGKILQVVNGAWAKVEVKDSSIATYVDDYIGSALEGDY